MLFDKKQLDAYMIRRHSEFLRLLENNNLARKIEITNSLIDEKYEDLIYYRAQKPLPRGCAKYYLNYKRNIFLAKRIIDMYIDFLAGFIEN